MAYIVELLLMQLFAQECSYLFLQVGKIIITAKQGLKILRIHSQTSAIIMTNGIRKVRQGMDIFDKRILDSCKFISDRYLYMELTS